MSEFSFPDQEKESEFKRIFNCLPQSKLQGSTTRELDLRFLFLKGMEFEEGRIKKKFGICSLVDE